MATREVIFVPITPVGWCQHAKVQKRTGQRFGSGRWHALIYHSQRISLRGDKPLARLGASLTLRSSPEANLTLA